MSIASITTNYAVASKKGALINNGWKKPSDDALMINVGAAFDETMGSGSTGAVIEDSSGGFIVASHSYISHVVMRLWQRYRL
jgi:hypothetical protein